MAGKLNLVVVGALAVAVLVGGGFAMGVLGAPSVESVENHFGNVSESATVVHTDLGVSNPNPVGVQLSGATVNYTVGMNGVEMATGSKAGLGLARGNSTLAFTTRMRNDRIPAWWYTHVESGEISDVTVDATVTSSTLGRSVSTTQDRTVETDVVGQFNSTETRPVNATQPLVADPVLYVNETRGTWDRANLTRQRTPLDLDFTVYNPKLVPYAVTKVGYTVTMNDVTVGTGESERGYVIAPRSTETIEARTAIRNQHLDEWWVTHLRRNQVTDLRIDFYLVLEGGGESFRVDLDAIDYEKTIETDIFGNKAQYPTGTDSSGAGTDDEDQEATPTPTATETATETATPTATEDDGGLLGDDSTMATETATGTASPTATETTTPTETATEDEGLL
ncbi:LEA type 2 family protein [Halomicroarcula sp. GCM10025817]|uniref:LEA type 2 family protein n=1 Tax=Haloarcula TaxID=2237 RepID=UPI0023E86569|nr:LEA type 2 family protein [Halomicroarcula sp. SYNS111]